MSSYWSRPHTKLSTVRKYPAQDLCRRFMSLTCQEIFQSLDSKKVYLQDLFASIKPSV